MNESDDESQKKINTQISYIMKTLPQNVDTNNLEKIKMFIHKPWHEPKIKTHIKDTSKEKETVNHQTRKFDKNSLILYTDGSMLEQRVGAAMICKNNNEYRQIRLSTKAEVVDAETVAIRKAIQY